MKRLVFLGLCFLLFMGACEGNFPDPRREEVRGLLNRYGNALLAGDYDAARSCLVPGGPRDKSFDLVFQTIQNILHTEPQYSQGICSLPLFGVEIERITWGEVWAEVCLKSRQVCGFCENTWVIPYPVPLPEYAYTTPPYPPQDVSPFNQWVCFENFFLIDSDTVLLKKVGDEWLIY